MDENSILFNEEMLSKITRLEVIDHARGRGRAYTNYFVPELQLSLQDDGRTLKLFVVNKPEDEKVD